MELAVMHQQLDPEIQFVHATQEKAFGFKHTLYYKGRHLNT